MRLDLKEDQMSSQRRVTEPTSSAGHLAPHATRSTAEIFTIAWPLGDQGDLTEEQAVAEAREIVANPDAHEWLPWKASTTKPDA